MSGLTEKEIEDLKQQFEEFDTDGSKTLCASEIGSFLRCAGQNPTDQEIQEFLEQLDTDGDKRIDFDEFIKPFEKSCSADPTAELLAAFKVLDKNGNGVLDKQEMKHILTALKKAEGKHDDSQGVCEDEFTEEEINEFLKVADTNKDGVLTQEEWVKALTS